MLQWDDENCSPARMSSIKQSRSSGSMASLRRVFRTLNMPQVCANLACIRNSRTKKTCRGEPAQVFRRPDGTRTPDETASGLDQRRGLSEGLLRELGTEGVLFGELHARVRRPPAESPPDHGGERNEGPSVAHRQSSCSAWIS